jgi:ribose transport system permease protein
MKEDTKIITEWEESKKGLPSILKNFSAPIILALLIIFNMIVTPNFVAVQTFWNLIVQSCECILVAAGMTLVISSGGIDISVGAIMALSGVVCEKLIETTGQVAIGITGGILASILIGIFNGFMIGKFKIQPIIITLITMMAGRGIAQVITDGNILFVRDPFVVGLGTDRLFTIRMPIQIIFIIIAIALVFLITNRTVIGSYIQTLGDNSTAARLSGVNTLLTIIFVYGMSGLFSGIAGIVQAARVSIADPNQLGKLGELTAIASVAIGGTSMAGGRARIIGSLFGAFLLTLITITFNMNNIPASYSQVIITILIILAVYFQSERKIK